LKDVDGVLNKRFAPEISQTFVKAHS